MIKIKREHWYFIALFFVMLAFFRPAHYIIGSFFDKVWRMYTYFISGIGIFYYATHLKQSFNKKELGVLFIISSNLLCFAFSTILNFHNVNFSSALQYSITMTGFICVSHFGFKHYPKQFIEAFLAETLPMTIIHMCTFYIYQGVGMRSGVNGAIGRQFTDNWYFLTHANASYFIILPVAVMLFVYAIRYNIKFYPIAYGYLVFSIISFAFQKSVAGLVGFVVFLALLLLNTFVLEPKKIKLNSSLFFVIIMIFCYFLTFMHGLDHMLDFFDKYFDKNQSLVDRINIWKNADPYIKHSFLFGYGWELEKMTVQKLSYNHLHNILMEIIYRGGVIAFIIFAAGVFLITSNKNIKYQRLFQILSIGLIAFWVASTFDYYLYRHEVLIIYIMLADLKYILKEIEIKKMVRELFGVKRRINL